MSDATGLLVRRAALADSQRIFEWRNDPTTRAVSGSSEPLDRRAHERWYSAAISDQTRFLYIVELLQGIPVGMCRFDLAADNRSAETSINLAPDQRGIGLGRPLLAACIESFRSDGLTPAVLTATIRPDNAASLRIFESVGFAETGRTEEFLRLARDL